ncbi:MAG: nucleotidyltransferase domain-containing protein [Muribaculaceae bacterium]|nr:nucleotidyltransferase domain-containing protein [Muribaculaceae bacterium]
MDLTLINNLQAYFQSQPVEKVWLFGSFSRGEERPDSDIDFIVEFSQDAKIGLQYFRIISDLEDISKRRVDLAEIDMIDAKIKRQVNNEKILIYERSC